MDKYQIAIVPQKENHAGAKAVDDAMDIVSSLGYKTIYIYGHEGISFADKILRQLNQIYGWSKVYRQIENNATVFIQNPCRTKILKNSVIKRLKNKKNVSIVTLVHDVEELRGILMTSHMKKEFEFMLETSDYFIVHNEVMKDFFVKRGIHEAKIIVLEIFDYLYQPTDKSKPKFEKVINVAGNLDVIKSKYIGKLGEIGNVYVNLYGPNFSTQLEKHSNIKYCGSFPPDEVPTKLCSGFGLVWDGDSIETCSGPTGNYLRYNNPHKLSLYIASGLPVVIWDEAAEAKFVKEHNLGITVSSLKELEERFSNCTQEEYDDYVLSVEKIAEKIRNGYYLKNALNKLN